MISTYLRRIWTTPLPGLTPGEAFVTGFLFWPVAVGVAAACSALLSWLVLP